MIAQDDETVVQAVQDGQKEAFAGLVERHKESVYGTLMRLTGDPQVAEELAHETFVRAYQSLASFRGEARFGTWLIRIAINLARDHLRERRRDRTISLEAMLERDPDSPVFVEHRAGSDPSSEVGARDLVEQFETALRELPDGYCEVFVLHHVQSMSYEDIAAATGDSVGSLKVRAHRARKLLRERLFPESKVVTPENVEG
ncbi:MAG: sigma-70 family RNA polymerase sigma factor [Candidatus Eisenbacteria bacterium]